MSVFLREERYIHEWAPAKRRYRCIECNEVINKGDWHTHSSLFPEGEGRVTMRMCRRCTQLRFMVQKYESPIDETYYGDLLETANRLGISIETTHE